MKCPYCDSLNTFVVDTRMNVDGTIKRRRHQCNECSERFTTYETYTAELPELKHKILNIKAALHNLERMIRE